MEQNSLMLDEEFKDAMDELIPGIKRELSGNEAEEDKEDEIIGFGSDVFDLMLCNAHKKYLVPVLKFLLLFYHLN